MKVTIKESPDVVLAAGEYGFPCGETNCNSSPDWELRIRGQAYDFEFLMPVCAMHAKLLHDEMSLRRGQN